MKTLINKSPVNTVCGVSTLPGQMWLAKSGEIVEIYPTLEGPVGAIDRDGEHVPMSTMERTLSNSEEKEYRLSMMQSA